MNKTTLPSEGTILCIEQVLLLEKLFLSDPGLTLTNSFYRSSDDGIVNTTKHNLSSNETLDQLMKNYNNYIQFIFKYCDKKKEKKQVFDEEDYDNHVHFLAQEYFYYEPINISNRYSFYLNLVEIIVDFDELNVDIFENFIEHLKNNKNFISDDITIYDITIPAFPSTLDTIQHCAYWDLMALREKYYLTKIKSFFQDSFIQIIKDLKIDKDTKYILTSMPMNLELSIQQKDNIVFQNTFSGEQIPENKDYSQIKIESRIFDFSELFDDKINISLTLTNILTHSINTKVLDDFKRDLDIFAQKQLLFAGTEKNINLSNTQKRM